ncbi:PAWR protein, partial [Polyodon spathula]|nr:PAWR protein [Polyodon spathula]
MATGGFRAPNTATDFLEEWKAKREKMRAKMLGELAASGSSTGSVVGSSNELNNNGNPDRGVSSTFNCVSVSSHSMARSQPSSAVRKIDDDPQQAVAGRGADPAGGKEKSKGSGPSARKGKGQIDKRKIREKRRSTGVVNIPCEVGTNTLSPS